MELLRNERTTRLGRLGELLAAERLEDHGFSDVENLNAKRINFPFADLVAVRDGRRFLISVKARNEMRLGGLGKRLLDLVERCDEKFCEGSQLEGVQTLVVPAKPGELRSAGPGNPRGPRSDGPAKPGELTSGGPAKPGELPSDGPG